jgi:hypothetical protein
MVPSVKLGCAVMEGPARPVVVEEVTTALEEGPACGIDLAIVAATCAFMWGVTLMPSWYCQDGGCGAPGDGEVSPLVLLLSEDVTPSARSFVQGGLGRW